MARGNNDFLAGSGMSAESQHASVMNASAVPSSDFEGSYEGPGTYTSPMAQLLQKKAWESRMRKEMPEEGKNKFLWTQEED
jgi:hypothetical protein